MPLKKPIILTSFDLLMALYITLIQLFATSSFNFETLKNCAIGQDTNQNLYPFTVSVASIFQAIGINVIILDISDTWPDRIGVPQEEIC